MVIYEIKPDRIDLVPTTSFEAERFRERGDLQRLLRDHVEVVAPGTMVVAEEFGDWEDPKRRIELLGLDEDANLVVFELKRTEGGGHMELQAIRYATMVSAMTFDQVVAAHGAYLARRGIEADAAAAILEFLDWVEPNPPAFAQRVRLVLVAEGFSRELTTAVMWLNQHDVDIRCVRLTPYSLGGQLLIDVQQTIPLPEAAEYQVQIRNKTQQERLTRDTERDYTRYDVTVDGTVDAGLPKRHAMFRVVKALCGRGVTPERIADVVPGGSRRWLWVEGEVDADAFKAMAAERARSEGRQFEARRWFCGPDDLVHVGGRTYAFSNQWGSGRVKFGNLLSAVLAAFPEANISFRETE